MSREQALAVVSGLAVGLGTDGEAVSRLLERVANHAHAEALRAALVEEGAARVLAFIALDAQGDEALRL